MGFIQQNRVLHPLSGSLGFSLDVSSIGRWGGRVESHGFPANGGFKAKICHFSFVR